RGFHVTGVQTCALPISTLRICSVEWGMRPFLPVRVEGPSWLSAGSAAVRAGARRAVMAGCPGRREAPAGEGKPPPAARPGQAPRAPARRRTVAVHPPRRRTMGIWRHALAHWEGDLKNGGGKLDTPASGLMSATPYGFGSRFGDAKGTNPEELIA